MPVQHGRSVAAAIAALFVFGAAGCGEEHQATKTVTVTREVAARVPAQAAAPVRRPRPRPKSPPSRARVTFQACDENIFAKAQTTTCEFAENTFYGYYLADQTSPIEVWSPAAHQHFTTRCAAGTTVVCRTSDGGVVRFSQASIERYTSANAAAYADSPNLGPDRETASAHDDPYDNGSTDDSSPDPYNGDGYSESYDSGDSYGTGHGDSAAFCSTHDCIDNYDEGTGSTVQCADGTWSHSGGHSGACSWHGGVGRR